MKIPKLIAFYFPQFHEIPENNQWWGKGFTDWKLVKDSKPLFDGHHQPRVPIDDNYYNPCNKETLKSQAELAKKYGIDGFMFYHYWFDGKLYLEKPLETFLQNKDIDISFCLTWANESWTRSWIGKPEVFLQKQLHSNDMKIWERHFNYLLPFLKDPRAIMIDDKPVLQIYQPFLINNSKEMIDFWNDLAIKNGLKGLYLIAIKNHDFQSTDFLTSYDAIMKFQPREAYTSKNFQEFNVSARFQFLRKLPHIVQLYITKLNQKVSKYKIYDSRKIWNIIQEKSFINDYKEFQLKIFESAFFEWDNTPRYKNNAKIFTGLNDEEKKNNLKNLLKEAIKNDSSHVFFNAWNEWSESAYLEPDTKNGFKNLEIIKEVTDEIKNEFKVF
jgi:hypothetical protein